MTPFDLADPDMRLAPADTDQPAPPDRPPVFLHCGWRTRGTWIWNRFRQQRGVADYYEPLAESLASIRPDTLASIDADSWPSGHKGLDRPYFDGFRPLLAPDGPGVRGYRSQFATDDFFAAAAAALPALEGYLCRLLRTAQARGEQPVLKFCRSIGRIAWMQRRFPAAVHVAVLRNPFAQFDSALRQFVLHGNLYFLAMPLLLLTVNRDLPAVAAAARHLDVALPSLAGCRTLRARLAACEASVRGGDPAAWYRGFLAFWLVCAAAIPDSIDLIIDSDRLVHASHYRLTCEMELARRTGQMVDFGDADAADEPGAAAAGCLRRSGFLDAHRRAETFLAEQCGAGWADTPRLGQVGMLLAEAALAVLGGDMVRPAARPDAAALPAEAATLLSAMGRAAWAERELDAARQELVAVYNSHSWRVTAPLRWVRERRLGA